MLGFGKVDVKYLMDKLEIDEEKQKELMPIIKDNYYGYVFSDMIEEDLEEYKIYNSNMTLYFLNCYIEQNRIPKQLIDTNIISDYRKIEGFMDLCKNKGKIDILEKIVANEYIESELTEKFNSEISFDEKDLISLLFYLGYLTIAEIGYSRCKFKAPNDVIREVYTEYYLTYLSKKAEIEKNSIDTERMNYEILEKGKYIKLEDYEKDNNLLERKQEEAKNQLEKYKNTEEISLIPNIRCYSVVAIKDRLDVKEI